MGQQQPGSAAFNLGPRAKIGKVQATNIVGGDMVVQATPAQAAAVEDRQQLLALLKQLQTQVAALEAPAALRGDASDELAKAHQAGEQSDDDRLVEKLHTAQGYLERIGQTLPAALALAQTVAVLAQRVTGLG